jgi:hypothetical protein
MTKYDELWNLRLEQFAEYKQTHAGSCSVPSGYAPIPALGHWVFTQRKLKKMKKISVEREKKLNAIGFVWTRGQELASNVPWNTRFQQLLEYKKENGDCNVSKSNSSQHIDLRRWVVVQRHSKKSARLSEECEAKLNAIGFIWTRQYLGVWALRFQQLLEYKQAFGDCNVPCNFSRNPKLGKWVYNQRWRGNNIELKNERRWSQLNAIGFDWGQQGKIGRAVPTTTTTTTTTRTTNDPVILLRETRVAELSSEVFETHENQWETRFQELLEHFQENRDFNVHQYYPLNPLLAGWVSEQRNDYDLQGRGEQTSLTPLREAKLNAIGFTWFVDGDGSSSSSSSSSDAPAQDVVSSSSVVRPEEAKSGSVRKPEVRS